MPSLFSVAPNATMSGTADKETERSRVFKPVVICAPFDPPQVKPSCTSVGLKEAVGVIAKTKLCAAPTDMLTVSSVLPVTALVDGSVA